MLRQVFCTTAIRNLLKVVGSSTCLLSDCESSESSCGSCSKKAWQEEGLPSFFLHQTIFNIRISKSSRMKFNVPSRTRRSSRPWWSTQTRSSCTWSVFLSRFPTDWIIEVVRNESLFSLGISSLAGIEQRNDLLKTNFITKVPNQHGRNLHLLKGWTFKDVFEVRFQLGKLWN